MPAQTVIKLRRDTAADWTTADSVLAAGELGIETDTNRIKIGDGVTEWTGLKYGPVGAELAIRVKNASGSVAIPAGRLVQFAGAAGDTVTASPAVTDGSVDFHLLIGITSTEIAADGFGDVILTGVVDGIDTSSYTVGTLLYADDANPGQLAATVPTAPSFGEPVAAVTRSGAGTSGLILVRLHLGATVGELHDVDLTTPTSGQVLQYDGTNWVNATLDALPDQTGHAGEYLTTDGTDASWGTLDIPPGTTVSDTAPSSPELGQMWWDSTDGTLYIYYDGFWVASTTGVVGPQGDPGIEAGATAPTDTTLLWLDTTEDGDMVVPSGGTTGQVLAKATGDDYDTEWATKADVPLSTVTTAGDLIVADGASSVTNLGVGANGSLLYSDGTNPSWLANSGTEGDILQVNATGGVEWVTPSGGGNVLISSGSVVGLSTLTLSSIPATYKDLDFRVKNFGSTTANVFPSFIVNNDSSTNYEGIRAYTSTTLQQFTSRNDIFNLGALSGTTGTLFYDIYDYASSTDVIRIEANQSGYDKSVGWWRYLGGGAINRIDVTFPDAPDSGTYELWGII